MENIILSTVLDTDSYKLSHWKQYPKGTSAMLSYLESRGGKYKNTVFFGLQYYLKKYLSHRITMEEVDEAAAFAKDHGVPFNYDGWKRIATVLKGKLPVRIKAVPEGTIVPTGNILMSVESTDPETFWVVSWLETLLVRLWYPITGATQSYHIKQLLKEFLDRTADDTEAEIGFKLHDFGSRGVSSQESAMIGGAAHLINFMGSDTIAGIYMANKYYYSDMAAFSIPASEHSTMTMWGKENEAKAYANMLEQYKDQPIFACVSDSYDIFNAARSIWGGELKEKVIMYDGTVVVRPDSGDPATVVLKLLQELEGAFGVVHNKKGYKIINHNVRVIQGDGVNEDSIKKILEIITSPAHRYSATNIAFGMGGALLQQFNRDTQKFAFKCSWAKVDGKEIDVYKDPVTDTVKKSKRGRLDLNREEGVVNTCRESEVTNSLLELVYENGVITKVVTLDSVRARANRKPYESAPSKKTHKVKLKAS
jgi:nicotinamide phosphoribosyltransferase